jgi:pantothenate kinase
VHEPVGTSCEGAPPVVRETVQQLVERAAALASGGRRLLGITGAPDTFDVDGYVALLQRLRTPSDRTVYGPVFDRDLEEAIGSAVPVPPDTPLVLTEGNYLLVQDHGWSEVRPRLDEVWYLDVPPEVRAGRLLRRRLSHGHERRASEDWVRTVDLPNGEVVEASRGRADLVVQLDAAELPAGEGQQG